MIVVTTPTGKIGSRVVRLLLQSGVRPRVLVRDAGRLLPEVRDRVEVVEGDQRDSDTVLRATEGADALLWVNPSTGEADPVEAYARLGALAARAVTTHGIDRTVFVSSGGAEKRHGAGEIDGLARTEELLDATGSSVLHLRCGYFFSNLLMDLDGLRAGVLGTPWPLDHAMPWVDPRDIGDVAATRLLTTAWSGRQVQAVHGPQDLTFRQVASILSVVLGKPVRAETIPEAEFRAMLRAAGLGPRQVGGIVGMSSGLGPGFVAENPRDVLTTTPTTLASWALSTLLPML